MCYYLTTILVLNTLDIYHTRLIIIIYVKFIFISINDREQETKILISSNQ